MYIVSHNGPASSQMEALIHRKIIRCPQKQAPNFRDLEAILVEVSGKPESVILSQQRFAYLEHRLGGGKREARSNRISQPPMTMKAVDQFTALLVRRARVLM